MKSGVAHPMCTRGLFTITFTYTRLGYTFHPPLPYLIFVFFHNLMSYKSEHSECPCQICTHYVDNEKNMAKPRSLSLYLPGQIVKNKNIGHANNQKTSVISHLIYSFLMQLWFGGAHARVYMSANAFGINCMTSMSCIFRKKILDDEGGLATLGSYLGEDYFLAQLIINK